MTFACRGFMESSCMISLYFVFLFSFAWDDLAGEYNQ